MPEPTKVKRSKLLMPVSRKGVMEALHPNTKKMLNRLLPITLPMAISGFFFKAATIDGSILVLCYIAYTTYLIYQI